MKTNIPSVNKNIYRRIYHLQYIPFLITLIIVFFSSTLSAQDIGRIIKSDPFKVSGSISANAGTYSASGIENRTGSFRYGIAARLNFDIYSFKIPLYAAFRDNQLNYGYSFSRFRINPQYKWIKLSIGDTQMQFNSYTLSGRTVKGGGIELTPGKFRFKALYGKMEDLNSYRDTLGIGRSMLPTYKRRLAGVSLGVGSSSSYFDLYAVKTWDRLDSLENQSFNREFQRKDNLVFGSTISLKLFKRLKFKTDLGLSLLTRNVDSYTPTEGVGANQVTGYALEYNGTSDYSYGGNVLLSYAGRRYSINGKVKYIQPYFRPLSVPFIATDLINYTIGGSFNMLRNRASINGSVGVQRNNLSGIKTSTANNFIVNVAANMRLTKSLNASAQYSNYAQDYVAESVQIDDLYTFAITNNIMAASLRYNTKFDKNRFTTGLSVSRSGFSTVSDNDDLSRSYNSLSTAFQTGYYLDRLGINMNGGLTYRTYNRVGSNSSNYGVRLGLSKSFLKKKITSSLRSSYNLIQRENVGDGNSMNNTLNLGYKISKKSNLSLNIAHVLRNPSNQDSFSEIRSSVRIMQRF